MTGINCIRSLLIPRVAVQSWQSILRNIQRGDPGTSFMAAERNEGVVAECGVQWRSGQMSWPWISGYRVQTVLSIFIQVMG